MRNKLTNVKSTNNNTGEVLTPKYNFGNYDVSFQLYEENYQQVKLKDLKKEELKDFNDLVLEIIKCTTEEEFTRLNRGKTNPAKRTKLCNHKWCEDIIHLGKGHTSFRLHGIRIGQSFKIISIDPKHKVNKI